MRDLIDRDGDRWFAVADGVYVYADTREEAEWKNLPGGPGGVPRDFVARQFGPVTEVTDDGRKASTM